MTSPDSCQRHTGFFQLRSQSAAELVADNRKGLIEQA